MKKLLTKCALLLLLCAALAPPARAASDAWDGTVDISWYDPAKTEYEIDTPAKFAGLAALVNGMADPTAKKIVGNTAYLVSKKVDNVMLVGAGGGNVFDTVYTGGIDFAYKTIYLTADLDMGGRKSADGSLGSNEGMDVYNCYSAGKIDTNGTQYGRGIGGHDTGSYTVSGCWYLSGSDDDPALNGYYMGTSRRITVDVTAATAQELQSDSVLQALNRNGAVFAQDTAGKNGGYPILWFENGQKNADCQLTQASAANGTLTVSQTGAVRFGASVSLTAQPAAGYRLAYFTANGNQILGDYYTVTGDTELAAVFQKVKTASVTVPEYDAFYLAAARTG